MKKGIATLVAILIVTTLLCGCSDRTSEWQERHADKFARLDYYTNFHRNDCIDLTEALANIELSAHFDSKSGYVFIEPEHRLGRLKFIIEVKCYIDDEGRLYCGEYTCSVGGTREIVISINGGEVPKGGAILPSLSVLVDGTRFEFSYKSFIEIDSIIQCFLECDIDELIDEITNTNEEIIEPDESRII
jgi:hypothetical protein